MMDYTALQWIWLGVAAFAAGLSKMGLGAVIMLVIPVVASLFGGKESTGLMLPLLMTADVFAVLYYRKNIRFQEIRRLLPWLCAGLLIGLLVGRYINDVQFKAVLSVTVVICLASMIYADVKGRPVAVPDRLLVYALAGILAGFTSMIGNAAGAIVTMYFLSRGYQKDSLISTSVWLFFILNLIKLPLQVFVWHNIGISGLYTALILIPVVLAGAVAGAYAVKRINEKVYKIVLYVMILIAAVALWLR
ncbi:MAG: sulfite exporter TauE/SafE family protein [Firmicutes bacterium]|nr:sulfite exporter TauE/SafE family protein [Bacillota bacterium]